MRLLIGLLFVIFISTCAPRRMGRVDYMPITKEELLEQPLDIPLNIESFDTAYSKFKLRTFIRTLSSDQRKDTIYRYYKNKSSFIFYKTQDRGSFFLTAKIRDDEISLKNNIGIGLEKDLLDERLTGLPKMSSDTLNINNNDLQLLFIFKSNLLNEIHINNYFEQ